MGLFYRRPLCFFCFLFLLTSVMAANYKYLTHPAVLAIVVMLAFATVILCICIRKKQNLFIGILLCIAAVLGALMNDALRIESKQGLAEEYVGNRTVLMQISEKHYASESSSAYTVRIESISGDEVSLKAALITAFPLELSVGDTLVATVELVAADEEVAGATASRVSGEPDVLLGAALYEPDHALVKRFDYTLPWYKYIFEDNGISVAIFRAKSAVTERMDNLLGERASALAKAFLLGDKGDISTETVRDFRRTGLSHVFAVSGMHISILLGALDIIMRKLLVHKYIRVLVVSAAAVPMLALTGFAMSAVRSVLMLWIAYVTYLLSEESDGTTRLFTAITIILIVLPYSVYDLGLWLSFLATLAIVTVFTYVHQKYHGKKREKLILRFARGILLSAALTIICSIFLLPMQWYFFGEISIMSVIANVIVSPIATVYMVAVIVSLIIGNVPVLGALSVYVVRGVGSLIEFVVGTFARPDFATISLEYKFADILVILFTVSFTLVLVLKLRRKWIVALPPLVFAAVFSVCVGVFHFSAPQRVEYYSDGANQIFSISQAESLAVVDMTNGAYSRYTEVMNDARRMGTTTLDKLIFTDISERHISSMDYFFRANIVNSIYIPTPSGEEQIYMAYKMARLADECAVKVYLYQNFDKIEHKDVLLCVGNISVEERASASVFVCLSESTIGYAEPNICKSELYSSINRALSLCNTVIIGDNGICDVPYKFTLAEGTTLVYSSEQLRQMSRVHNMSGENYCNINKRFKIELLFK